MPPRVSYSQVAARVMFAVSFFPVLHTTSYSYSLKKPNPFSPNDVAHVDESGATEYYSRE